MKNLNEYQLDSDGNFDKRFVDNSVTSKSGTSVYFRNLEGKLVENISKADAVFGAVAWLTSDTILDALSQVDHVSIVIQKEDFLRPDVDSKSDWKTKLREKYEALSCGLERYSFDNILSSVSVASDPTLQPVRCVGNHNRDKKPAFPRMHNKFLVFAEVSNEEDSEFEKVKPYAVWTGSFNLTKNASMSLENALLLTDEEIVKAYYDEFAQIAAMSEGLDWTSDWIEPEWRIGT